MSKLARQRLHALGSPDEMARSPLDQAPTLCTIGPGSALAADVTRQGDVTGIKAFVVVLMISAISSLKCLRLECHSPAYESRRPCRSSAIASTNSNKHYA